MSVGWVGEKELSLCSQSCLNVLLAINVLLTSVDYTNVTCRNGIKDQAVARMKMQVGLRLRRKLSRKQHCKWDISREIH